MGLFTRKKKYVSSGSFLKDLQKMRRHYRKKPIVQKELPKPEALKVHKDDPLNIIFRDKDVVFQNGQVYYSCLVQANEHLFNPRSNLNCPANVIYSTHQIAEKYPEFLSDISDEIFSYKGKSLDSVPESLREIVRIITDEYDRSGVDFYINLRNPENPNEIIENVDVHFCSIMVFRDDIPGGVLKGRYYPILAAPSFSPIVLILPQKYWTASEYV